ncbi:transglycosylase SLT domain-containing protein [Arenibaculum sp.]|jgi:hypothetical protein|uniref:transglycosylase SLT domain-containing protein n=1 Tax=Arenibaculum sp. TaxID=2865862 RepID=UPI002E0F63D1|nr:transglycosylase SLT domain-containing protein [Arenibaculum sp.]
MSIPNSAHSSIEAQTARGPAGSGRASVTTAIRDAARKTGVDFSYLMEKAAQESGFDPAAKARTSSATGLYQFIESTWLTMIDEHGSRHGLGDVAARIERRADGRRVVADPEERKAILELREDPRIASLMAAEFTRENREHLAREVGGRIGATELYMAHFLGAGGAAKFLDAHRSDPGKPASALLPQAAAANRAVFYGPEGRPRSVAEVYERFAQRFGEAGDVAKGPRLVGAQEGDGRGAAMTAAAGGAPSAVSGAEPLSLFTVMLLSQLGTPDEGDTGRRDEAGQEARAPRPIPALA